MATTKITKINEIITTSQCETRGVGAEFAKTLKDGDVVYLKGEPGAGKTVFSKGVASELGILEEILSPTFALVNIYGENTLLHFDMYRISSEDEAYEAGLFDLIYGDGIKLIEWPENIEDYLSLESFYVVKIDYRDGENRKIEIWREEA